MRRARATGPLVAALAVAALVAGCGGVQDASVGSAAGDFLDAARHGDGGAACALLAPAARQDLAETSGKPCAEAVLGEDLGADDTGAADVEVFSTMAQAKVGSQTLFLSRYDGRWLVVAAACTPVAGHPYECSIGLP